MNKYIIQDWAGNVLDYKGRIEKPEFAVAMEFDDFESAWEYVQEHYSPDDWEEYVVIEKEIK